MSENRVPRKFFGLHADLVWPKLELRIQNKVAVRNFGFQSTILALGKFSTCAILRMVQFLRQFGGYVAPNWLKFRLIVAN
jgi:hypothetical protein